MKQPDDPAAADRRQIGDVLALIQQLTGDVAQTDSIADLFASAFRATGSVVPFDIGVAVMLEQDLDLYIAAREGAVIEERFVQKIRITLHRLLTLSFSETDAVVKSEVRTLPGTPVGDPLEHEAYAILTQRNRTAGVLLLFRGGAPLAPYEQQIVEIVAAQVSMLLGNLRAREEIVNLADTDDLTGIWNKRWFRRQLPQEIERARVYNLPLTLLIFDVDDFKQINDSFGHTIGDVVLSELCGSVRESLRPPDLFARFGGDEFSIILPHTDLGGACVVAERILSKVRSLTIPTDDEGALRCSISMGIADFQSADSANDLVRRADEQLYLSKRQGKNRYTA